MQEVRNPHIFPWLFDLRVLSQDCLLIVPQLAVSPSLFSSLPWEDGHTNYHVGLLPIRFGLIPLMEAIGEGESQGLFKKLKNLL